MRTYTRRRQYKLIDDVQEKCRLCLEKPTDKIPIFNTTHSCASLAVRIMMCVGYEISPKEELPNFICTDCFKKFSHSYGFKKRCGIVHQKLVQHMKALKLMKQKDTGNAEPKQTDNQCNAPVEKRHRIASYEELVYETLSETEHEVPVQVNPTLIPNPTVEHTENTQINVEDIFLKTHESVIKCLPSQVIEEKEKRSPSPEPQPPDMSGFLSSVLVELNVLKKDGNEVILKDPTLRTVEIETGDETVITLNMYEVEEEIPLEKELNKKNVYLQEDNNEKDESEEKQVKTFSLPKCAQCGKVFASSSALRRHGRVHSGERPYVCAVCNRGFAQKEVLVRHALVHTDQRPHKCLECPKSFTQRSGLEAHARSHAAPHERPLAIHSCTKCSKVFLHGSGLSRHMMTHNGRVFECASCTRRFTDHSSLLRHLRVMHRADVRPTSVIAPNPSATLRPLHSA